jgi:hypothetical protein
MADVAGPKVLDNPSTAQSAAGRSGTPSASPYGKVQRRDVRFAEIFSGSIDSRKGSCMTSSSWRWLEPFSAEEAVPYARPSPMPCASLVTSRNAL